MIKICDKVFFPVPKHLVKKFLQMGEKYDGLPRYNSIFRNQPSYTYFNKTFEDDPFDPLFLTLNDIDSGFLEPKQLADKRGFDSFILTDPRTQQPLKQYVYDHTKEEIPKLFHSPKWSNLNKAQHSIGVKIVKARQEGRQITEDDFLIWHRVEKIRIKESQAFSKFVFEYDQTNKESMYTPARRLLELYKKWHESKCKSLMIKYPAETFNTHLGLPHVKVCRAVLKDQWADIVQVDILKQHGERLKLHTDQNVTFANFKCSLEVLTDDFIYSESLNDSVEEQLKTDSFRLIELEDPDFPMYYMPLETLLFLLLSGDYCDLPMEVVIDIKEHQSQSEGEKYIIMDTPLPARHLGWHTYKQVVEQASVALLSILKLNEDSNENVTEIKATQRDEELTTFTAVPFEEYLKFHSFSPDKKCKFSKTLTRWQLKASENSVIKHIFTSLNTAPELLGDYSIKLEYKPTFGCEFMTKYELLREWFKLKLQRGTKSTCYRLDINNFQTMLKETQSLPKLELLLNTIYHTQMPLLLSNLFEFLSLLSSMPTGHYLLRYNPKFKEKILLCKPSQELTQNTIHLHQLLRTEPSELLFMSQQNYLPIADDLCSRVHLAHNTLPCTFAPADQPQNTKSQKNMQKTFKILNDKASIVERAKNKRMLESKKSREHNNRTSKKRAQRARRSQRRAEGKSKEAKEQEELEREMLIDEQILGF